MSFFGHNQFDFFVKMAPFLSSVKLYPFGFFGLFVR